MSYQEALTVAAVQVALRSRLEEALRAIAALDANTPAVAGSNEAAEGFGCAEDLWTTIAESRGP